MNESLRYRADPTYKALEGLCGKAGVCVKYCTIPDDQIKGELWARSSDQDMTIEMPDADVFENEVQAALILGHELAHIVASVGSSDKPVDSLMNEAICDLLGAQFYKLAELMAGYEAEAIFRE